MVKLGKKKLAELSELSKRKSAGHVDSDENTKNGAGNSGDDENEVNKEANDKNETGSTKKQRASVGAAKASTQDDSESDESDDLPLNGSKSSSSSAPPRKKQKKTPKAKGKAPPPPPSSSSSSSATAKNDNKKSSSKSNDTEPEGDDEDDKEEAEFEVEAIVGHKSKRGESFFQVRWKGYGKDADSWEPEAELNCDDLIAEYRKANSKKNVVTKKSPTSVKGGRGRKLGKKTESDPDKEWAVERILDFVDDDEHGGLYRIRWKGFGAKEDTWEPESNLSCEGLIEKFKKGLEEQRNVDVKHLRESPKKTKRLVNETIPRSNLHNRIERSSKRAAAKNRVFYGEE